MKKRILTLVALLTLVNFSKAQHDLWSTTRINQPEEYTAELGTQNARSLYFITNDTIRMMLKGLGGKLNVKSLSNNELAENTKRFLFVDNDGNISADGLPANNGIVCGQGTTPWTLGGNSIPLATTNANIIGHCNNTDFILQANSKRAIILSPNGKLSIGEDNYNTNPTADLDISEKVAGSTRHRLRFYGNANGAIEASSNLNLMYTDEFMIRDNTYSATSWRSVFNIDNNGLVGIGDNLGGGVLGAKLTVKARTNWEDGIFVDMNDDVTDAFLVYNSTTSKTNYSVKTNGNTVIGDKTGTMNLNAKLIVNNTLANGNGIISRTNSNINRAFSVYNTNNNDETFFVQGNGYTEMKIYSPAGMPNNRALTIKDMSNNRDLFVVKSNGVVYAREIEVTNATTFPDYVFDANYQLKPIKEVAEFIATNKHLPGFEKGEHYEKNNINLNQLLIKQQEKIEELMLYIIQLEKRIDGLDKK